MESMPFERSVARGDARGRVRRAISGRGLGLLLWWAGALALLGMCVAEPPLFPLAAVLVVVLVGWRRQLR
ncbi:hypothetical protein GCM10027053_12570 [Intrasporangium mesophilum]